MSTSATSPPLGAWGRVLKSIAKFPQRTGRSVARLLNPDYRLERTAERAVDGFLDRATQRRLDALPGMSSDHECRLLCYLANVAPADGAIVEIGAWKGKSIAWLAAGSETRRRPLPLVSIDPHERGSWEDFQQTLHACRLGPDRLEVLRAYSHDVGRDWRRPISLLWVDGCHEYDAVVQDIADFAGHMLPGGWVVFDDAAGGKFPGVERAIAERMSTDERFRRIAVLRHLQLFRRTA